MLKSDPGAVILVPDENIITTVGAENCWFVNLMTVFCYSCLVH